MSTPTPNQQQYIEKIFNEGQLFQIRKKFNGLDLDKFDIELSDNFKKKFPRSVKFAKNSSSPTDVFKTKIAGKDYFVKVFDIKSTQLPVGQTEDPIGSLLYEKEIYRFLRSEAVKNKEIKKHFIQMILSAKDDVIKKGYIFTEDSGGVPLSKIKQNRASLKLYFKDDTHKMTALFVSNLFTQLLYIIYLLHSINIVHNDLHLGNILLVKDNISTKEYNMFGQKFVLRDHPYSLKVYDFDMSSIMKPSEWSNPFRKDLCILFGRCKDYAATDLYMWMVDMILSSKEDIVCTDNNCVWANAWSFVNPQEKVIFITVVDRFQHLMRKSIPKSFFQWLFQKFITPKPNMINIIQQRYSNWRRNGQDVMPIHVASCMRLEGFVQGNRKCQVPSKPVSGDIIAKVWKESTTPLVILTDYVKSVKSI